MRVLLVGDYPPPHGGVAVHVQQLHASLRERGVETVVLDIGKGGRPAPDVIPARTPVQYGGKLAGFLHEGWTVHVHTSGNNPKSWMLAATAAVHAPRSPRVITLHSGLLPDYLAHSLSRRVFARMALAGYSRVVAVSEAGREALGRCGVPAEKILVYPAFCASHEPAGEGAPEDPAGHGPPPFTCLWPRADVPRAAADRGRAARSGARGVRSGNPFGGVHTRCPGVRSRIAPGEPVGVGARPGARPHGALRCLHSSHHARRGCHLRARGARARGAVCGQ